MAAIILFHLSVALQTGQISGNQVGLISILQLGTAVFALFLSALSLYAWTRRKQPALIIVTAAFLAFFFKILVELSPDVGNLLQLLLVLTDFLILALFFVAIVVRPRRKQYI